MVEPLLENPMALTGKIAEALDGTAVERPGLSGFLSSRFDRFLNQLFASGNVAPQEAAAALEGRPGFVWLAEKPDAEELGRLRLLEMYGMTATTVVPAEQRPPQGEIVEVRSRDDLDGWFGVYAQVFGAHPAARSVWRCSTSVVISRSRVSMRGSEFARTQHMTSECKVLLHQTVKSV